MQLLINFNKHTTDSTLTNLTERDMVAKANTTLKLVNQNDPDKPQTIKFRPLNESKTIASFTKLTQQAPQNGSGNQHLTRPSS